MVDDTRNTDQDDLVNQIDEVVPDPLTVVSRERDDFRDLAVRLQADFENFRKRSASQMLDDVDRATGKVVESLLPVLDACQAGSAHGAPGMDPVYAALLTSLQRQGLEVLSPQGEPFDPATADAVLHEPGDGDGPVVVEVLRTGYLWKGRVLRPAIVRVKG